MNKQIVHLSLCLQPKFSLAYKLWNLLMLVMEYKSSMAYSANVT